MFNWLVNWLFGAESTGEFGTQSETPAEYRKRKKITTALNTASKTVRKEDNTNSGVLEGMLLYDALTQPTDTVEAVESFKGDGGEFGGAGASSSWDDSSSSSSDSFSSDSCSDYSSSDSGGYDSGGSDSGSCGGGD